MNAKLKSIAEQAAEDLQDFVREKDKDIMEAWRAAETEAKDQETKPMFKLGFAITLNLQDDKMETALSWSVKHKVSCDHEMPSADQPFLPGTERTKGRKGARS